MANSARTDLWPSTSIDPTSFRSLREAFDRRGELAKKFCMLDELRKLRKVRVGGCRIAGKGRRVDRGGVGSWGGI